MMTQKDKGLLLTDEEIENIFFECGQLYKPSLQYLTERIRQAQDAKTASIKDAECQQKVNEKMLELENEGLLAHEIQSYGASGRECEETCGACRLWQALKQEGIE